MVGVRGKGTLAYLDFNNDDEYLKVEAKVTSIKPTGPERARATQEPALDENIEFADTGTLTYTDIEMTLFWVPGDTDIDTPIDDAIKNDTEFNLAIMINLPTPQYVIQKVKIISAAPQAIERDAKVKRDVVFIIRSEPTYTTTEPTLEP